MMTRLLIAVMLLVPAPPNAPAPIPDLRGVCPWGTVSQDGVDVSISGSSWTAEGTIDGQTVKLHWRLADRFAEGTYKVEGRVISGRRHWLGDEVTVPERIEIRRETAEPPEF